VKEAMGLSQDTAKYEQVIHTALSLIAYLVQELGYGLEDRF